MRRTENMMSAGPDVCAWLKCVRKYKPLTREEETAVFDMIRHGSPAEKKAAEDRILMSNQRFVFSVAKEYARNSTSAGSASDGPSSRVLDFVSEGNIGMMTAVGKFDPERGVRFLSFAVHYIRQAMTEYSRVAGHPVRNTNGSKTWYRLGKAREKFMKDNLREPSEFELWTILHNSGVRVGEVSDVWDLRFDSVDSVFPDTDADFSSNPVFTDATAEDNEYIRKENTEWASEFSGKLLSCLDERSRNIVERLFGIGYDTPSDLETVAEETGLTPVRIGQIRTAAIKKMKSCAIKNGGSL